MLNKVTVAKIVRFNNCKVQLARMNVLADDGVTVIPKHVGAVLM